MWASRVRNWELGEGGYPTQRGMPGPRQGGEAHCTRDRVLAPLQRVSAS